MTQFLTPDSQILNYLVFVIRCGGTQEDKHAADWMWLFKRVASSGRKIRQGVMT